MEYRENGAERDIYSFKYLYHKRKYQINNLCFYFRKLEKEEQTTSKAR